MFNRAETSWSPYTIPATPTITNNDVYALSCSNGADSSNNPSQYLEWKKSIPDGTTNGSMLYWNSGTSSWEILSPPSGNFIYALTIQGNNLSWMRTEDCE
jgi:hypothetical protein